MCSGETDEKIPRLPDARGQTITISLISYPVGKLNNRTMEALHFILRKMAI